MTIPAEEVRAIQYTREWLMALADRKYRPGWKEIRRRAGAMLRHYPIQQRIDEIYKKAGVLR